MAWVPQLVHHGRRAPPPRSRATRTPTGRRNGLEFLTGTDPLNPQARWALDSQTDGITFRLTFPQIANRSVLIETSLDFQTWTLWDVPGNQPLFNATTEMRTLIGPATEPMRYFRARFSEQ